MGFGSGGEGVGFGTVRVWFQVHIFLLSVDIATAGEGILKMSP